VYVADLGLQTREYKGEEKPPAQQIALGIEIIGQTITLDDKEVPRMLWTRPFNIFSNLTEKGVELQYYKVFDPSAQPDGDADWDAQMGKPCNAFIVNTPGRGANAGNIYDNIDSLTPIPAKYQAGVGPALIEPCIGDADDEENACTKALYGLAKFVYDKRIEEAPAAPQAPAGMPDADFDDSDVPFN
jgi:hypothetical protein